MELKRLAEDLASLQARQEIRMDEMERRLEEIRNHVVWLELLLQPGDSRPWEHDEDRLDRLA